MRVVHLSHLVQESDRFLLWNEKINNCFFWIKGRPSMPLSMGTGTDDLTQSIVSKDQRPNKGYKNTKPFIYLGLKQRDLSSM